MFDIQGYYNASSVAEAVRLLEAHPQAVIIGGGSDVLIKMREGALAGAELVCIRDIKEINGVSEDESGDIYIGAMTAFSHVTNDPVIQKRIPVLGEAVDKVGGPQVRNIGTVGGNVCNGAVSADSAATLTAFEALLKLKSTSGERIVPIGEFYLGPGKVDIKPGELLTHIIIPKSHYDGYSGCYIKYSMRNAMDIATLGCTVLMKPDSACSKIEDIKIAFSVAAPVPKRCPEAEAALKGAKICPEIIRQIEQLVRKEIQPRDSWRASKDFRMHIAGEIAGRALTEAIEKAGGEIHE